MSRKVSVLFYQFTFEKQITSSDGRTVSAQTLSQQETISCFNDIQNKMKTLNNGRKVARPLNKDYVVEIINYDNGLLFAKIGHENPSSTVALRDSVTLESDPLQMSQTQLLETFTYFTIDFHTRVLCFIHLQSAPKVNNLKDFFLNYTKDMGVFPQTSIILSTDVIDKVCKKGFVSKIDFKIAVPADDILSNVVGLSMNEFDSLEHINTSTLTYNLVAKRGHKLFKNPSIIKSTCKKILNHHPDHLRVKFTDENGYAEEIDLLNSKFTKKVIFPVDNLNQLKEEDFKNELLNTYNTNKNELIKLIHQ